MRFKGKIAIVSGAAQGIGRAVAIRLAREGADLAVCDNNSEGVKQVCKEIVNLGQKGIGFDADVSNCIQVEDMVRRTFENFGRIDILVNNAGGSFNFPDKLEEITNEIWDKVVAVNLKGTFFCCRAVAPYMKSQKFGRIVNVSSKAGRYGPDLTGVEYTSAKAGVLGLTRHLAYELGPFGITVNAIAPGLVLSSPRMESLWLERKTTEEQRKAFLMTIPLRRLPTVDEQASVIVFLASDDASYVSGVTIDVNGGRFMS